MEDRTYLSKCFYPESKGIPGCRAEQSAPPRGVIVSGWRSLGRDRPPFALPLAENRNL